MSYSIKFWSIYLPKDECYTEATYVKENTWKIERQVLDAFPGKETVTTKDIAEKILNSRYEYDNQESENTYYSPEPETENEPGFQELKQIIESLETEIRREMQENEDFLNNIDEEEKQMRQEAENWENSLILEKFRKANEENARLLHQQ